MLISVTEQKHSDKDAHHRMGQKWDSGELGALFRNHWGQSWHWNCIPVSTERLPLQRGGSLSQQLGSIFHILMDTSLVVARRGEVYANKLHYNTNNISSLIAGTQRTSCWAVLFRDCILPYGSQTSQAMVHFTLDLWQNTKKWFIFTV